MEKGDQKEEDVDVLSFLGQSFWLDVAHNVCAHQVFFSTFFCFLEERPLDMRTRMLAFLLLYIFLGNYFKKLI